MADTWIFNQILAELKNQTAALNEILSALTTLNSAVAELVAAEQSAGIVMNIAKVPHGGASRMAAVVPSFSILDLDDYLITVEKTDGATPPTLTAIDPTLASLAVTSDNPAVAAVDAPSGMTAMLHGLAVGTANITAVVTYNNASEGPYSETVVATCAAVAGVPGIVMTLGPAVVR